MKIFRHSKLVSKADWQITVVVLVLSRLQHFLQLCLEYKHDHINNGGITSNCRKDRKEVTAASDESQIDRRWKGEEILVLCR